MGTGLVYCGDCGKRLGDQDFNRAQAQYIDDRPYCLACRPLASPAAESKAKYPRPAHPPPREVAAATTTTRRAVRPVESQESKRLVLIGGAIAGGAVVLLLVILLFVGGGSTPAPTPLPPNPDANRGKGPVAPTPPPTDAASQALKRLETAFQAGQDPAALVALGDEIRPLVVLTPHESRFREIMVSVQVRLDELKRAGETDAFMAAVRKALQEDKGFERRAELVLKFADALKVAGAKRPEVERLQLEYDTQHAAFQKRKGDEEAKTRQQAAQRLGPYNLNPQGFVCNWLLLGPFPNLEDKGLAVDFLGGEAAHQGSIDGGIDHGGQRFRWVMHASADGKMDFFASRALRIHNRDNIVNYGHCWLEAGADIDVVLKSGTDDGYKMWFDGKVVGEKHQHRPAKPDEETFRVRLTKGFHRILMKVEQGNGDHAFMLRVVTPGGQNPAGVRIWN